MLLSPASLFAGQKSGEGAAKISIRINLPPVKETVGSADITLIYKEGRCCFIQAASAPGLSNVTVMANNDEKTAKVRIALLAPYGMDGKKPLTLLVARFECRASKSLDIKDGFKVTAVIITDLAGSPISGISPADIKLDITTGGD